MDSKELETLWQAVYETFYDCYYQEVESELLIRRWQRFDEIVKILVALTTASSAVAGWTLWSEPGFRYLWASLAGVAAILSIVHAALSVPMRLKDWGEIARQFSGLRIEFETIQYKMELSPEAPLAELSQEFLVLRKRYGQTSQLLRNDLLRTDGLRNQAQSMLNVKLGLEDRK